ncbi:MAG: MerR family transcriptional regulator [Acidimicrobiales bacterium]
MAQDSEYLSIGEVLTQVQVEFPELSISKIRFLENQGLIDPERTPSGYRKFYQRDIDRLRTILQMQRETYMPLKRIRDALVEYDARSSQDDRSGQNGVGPSKISRGEVSDASARRRGEPLDLPPVLKLVEVMTEIEGESVSSERPSSDLEARESVEGAVSYPVDNLGDPSFRHLSTEEQLERISESLLTRYAAPRPHGGADPLPRADEARVEANHGSSRAPEVDWEAVRTDSPQSSSSSFDDRGSTAEEDLEVHRSALERHGTLDAVAEGPARKNSPNQSGLFSIEELARLSGAKISEIREMEEFGLIESRLYAGERYYAQIDFEIVQVVTVFRKYGVQARHLKMYKISAEREVGFMEQILSPTLRQRNPSARTRATEQLSDLKMLGSCLRGYYMEKMLAKYLDLS